MHLHNSRQAGMSGPLGIPFSEIDAMSRLLRVDLARWEVEILKALDSTYLASVSEARKRRTKNGGKG